MQSFLIQSFFIGKGISITLFLLVGGLFIGLIGGTMLALIPPSRKGWYRTARAYISLIRGTPFILQLSVLYFAVSLALHIPVPILLAGLIAFGMNSSAYISEILRSGIESVPKGQFEAAQTLYIPSFYLWRSIILPQVLRITWPSLVNETIALLKETALISTLGGMDIMRRAQLISAEYFTYFMPLCIAGIFYYSLVLMIEILGKIIQRKIQHDIHS